MNSAHVGLVHLVYTNTSSCKRYVHCALLNATSTTAICNCDCDCIWPLFSSEVLNTRAWLGYTVHACTFTRTAIIAFGACCTQNRASPLRNALRVRVRRPFTLCRLLFAKIRILHTHIQQLYLLFYWCTYWYCFCLVHL